MRILNGRSTALAIEDGNGNDNSNGDKVHGVVEDNKVLGTPRAVDEAERKRYLLVTNLFPRCVEM
jgi:uncharacterized Zn ribbon protein